METLLILTIFVLLFSFSYFIMNLYFKEKKYASYNPFKVEIPKKTVWLVDRFGKSRILNEGFQDYLPFIDDIEAVVSLREEVISPDKLEIFTLDNQKINLEYRVFYQVTDPLKAINKVYD